MMDKIQIMTPTEVRSRAEARHRERVAHEPFEQAEKIENLMKKIAIMIEKEIETEKLIRIPITKEEIIIIRNVLKLLRENGWRAYRHRNTLIITFPKSEKYFRYLFISIIINIILYYILNSVIKNYSTYRIDNLLEFISFSFVFIIYAFIYFSPFLLFIIYINEFRKQGWCEENYTARTEKIKMNNAD